MVSCPVCLTPPLLFRGDLVLRSAGGLKYVWKCRCGRLSGSARSFGARILWSFRCPSRDGTHVSVRPRDEDLSSPADVRTVDDVLAEWEEIVLAARAEEVLGS